MKIKNNKLNIKKGFTMIELLIVIAVLGILAVAVLSAINPIEQINRSRDTGTRSDAEQLLSAIERYNANSTAFWPWQDVTTDAAAIGWTQVTDLTPAGANCAMVDNLGADPSAGATCPGADEVKTSFINRLTGGNYNALYIQYDGNAGDSVFVCFSPQSGSFANEASIRCDAESADLPASACDGSCSTLAGAVGTADECICLP